MCHEIKGVRMGKIHNRQNEVGLAYQEKMRKQFLEVQGVVRKVSFPCGLEIILYI